MLEGRHGGLVGANALGEENGPVHGTWSLEEFLKWYLPLKT